MWKNAKQKLIFKISAGTSQKSPKMTSPRPPRGGGNATQNGPKTRQEDPKMVPRALLSIFKLLFSAQSALLRPTWRPRRPRRTPEDPRGGEIGPVGLLFGPTGVDFHDPFRRWWGHTVTAFFSRPGPAVCAKRLNKQFSL